MNKRLLLVEDTVSLATLYKQQIEKSDFEVDHAETGAAAKAFLKEDRYDVILLDLGLPDIPGIDILREVRSAFPGTSVVIITANASIAMAVQAVREGAYDYLIKPVTKDRLVTTIKNAVERSALKQALTSKAPVKGDGGFCGFIGSSPAMQTVYDKINSMARSKASVFITGESGTGKELCAEAIHRSSGRGHGPFVAINCGAIPKDLMESEIFGHLKGSFTGAIADRDGAARMADGGTLFLDEICELDLALQTKLLRFLQTGMIQRVGAASTEKVDIRVICATNRSPLEEVQAKRFRQDLYFRLHVLPIHMPALRERGPDIADIAQHLLVQFSAEEDKRFERISADAEQVLLQHDWPGNVRELQNAVRQCVVLNDADELSTEMLLPVTGGGAAQPVGVPMSATSHGATTLEMDVEELRQAQSRRAGLELWQIEKEAIESTIAACKGSIPKAAKILGVSPSTIYRKREAWQDEIAG